MALDIPKLFCLVRPVKGFRRLSTLYDVFAPEIVWPSRRLWREMRRVWPELPDAVGVIDATSQKIN